tara:strand:+ start:8393 stop:8950 length:558 start_codon:yes stop_codon:yes gene_type:complete
MEKSIDAALLKVQKEIVGIVKDSSNPYFKSAYFDINKALSVVRPILNKHGLLISQPTRYDKEVGKTLVYTIIVGFDEFRDSNIALPEINDPQKLGMCITYYRRYTLVGLLALEALDDDGNTAAEAVKETIQESDIEVVKKPKAKKAEVSAIIKAGDKAKARNYYVQHDWTGASNLETKLTSHFKS